MERTREVEIECQVCEHVFEKAQHLEQHEYDDEWVFATEPVCPACGEDLLLNIEGHGGGGHEREDFHADG